MRKSTVVRGAAVLGGLALCAVAGFAAGRSRYEADPGQTYIEQRLKVLGEAALRESEGEVLLVGDSISERSGVHRLCGREVFNVGVSGAKLNDMAGLASQVAGITKPARIFVAMGTNDAKAESPTDVDAWANQYTAMVRKFAPIPVTIIPAPVIEPDKKYSAYFSEANLRLLNARLPAIAAATGAKLLSRPAVDTVDGVHQSQVGAAEWRAPLEAGCI